MFGIFKKKFDLNAFIDGSMEGLRMVSSSHSKIWGFGKEERWNLDQDSGIIEFSYSDGDILNVTAPVQIVGTLNTEDNTFFWGWDHPSVYSELQQSAQQVLAFAEENDIKELMQQKVQCSQDQAWEYASIAMRVSELNGAYSAEAAPGTRVYVVFGEVTINPRHNKVVNKDTQDDA